jgi:hypothetical protein
MTFSCIFDDSMCVSFKHNPAGVLFQFWFCDATVFISNGAERQLRKLITYFCLVKHTNIYENKEPSVNSKVALCYLNYYASLSV